MAVSIPLEGTDRVVESSLIFEVMSASVNVIIWNSFCKSKWEDDSKLGIHMEGASVYINFSTAIALQDKGGNILLHVAEAERSTSLSVRVTVHLESKSCGALRIPVRVH